MEINFDPAEFKPFVEAAVRETLRQVEAEQQQLPGGRLAFPEPEAAALLGIPGHSLRDCRRRGEIQAAKIGSRICYTRESLMAFLASQRIGGPSR